MIVDCPKCAQPYDVASYRAGERLRCRCGQILVVPGEGVRTHVAPAVHCSNCGGELARGASTCPYCGALIDLVGARMTAYCPSCLAMSREGAKFCSSCGRPLVTRVQAPEKTDFNCPRCNVSMRRREVGSAHPLECPICCGLFIEVEVFEKLIREQQDRVAEFPATNRPERSTLESEQVTYLKCPFCRGIMNRLNYGRISGVIIDYCRQHGYWLDNGELEKIAKWVATGGLKLKAAREIEEMRAERQRLSIPRAQPFRASFNGGRSLEPGLAGIAEGLLELVGRLFDR